MSGASTSILRKKGRDEKRKRGRKNRLRRKKKRRTDLVMASICRKWGGKAVRRAGSNGKNLTATEEREAGKEGRRKKEKNNGQFGQRWQFSHSRNSDPPPPQHNNPLDSSSRLPFISLRNHILFSSFSFFFFFSFCPQMFPFSRSLLLLQRISSSPLATLSTRSTHVPSILALFSSFAFFRLILSFFLIHH